MPAVLSLPMLCRAGGNTCAACCHGDLVPRDRLDATVGRQTRLYARVVGERKPSLVRLLWYELCVRGVGGVGMALVLLVPVAGAFVAWRLRRRVTCAYLGYEDESGTRVGCMIHPARQGGRDVRRWAAFGLWWGLGCGEGEWTCPAGRRYQVASWRMRRDFAGAAKGCDWHEYERRAAGFGK